MNTQLFAILLLALAMLALSPLSHSADRLALVIGNSNYSIGKRLPNPVKDAESIKDELEKLGFAVLYHANVKDKDAMKQAVSEFSEQLAGKEIGLFYYSGHGLQHEGENYLMPTDAPIDKSWQITHEAMTLNYLMDAMRSAHPELSLVILDACRDDPYPRDQRSAASRGLARVDAPTSTIIAYATSPGKTADDGDGEHSPYTDALLQQLQQHSDKSILELLNDVGIAVVDSTQQQQNPLIELSSLRQKFCFGVCQSATALSKQIVAPVATIANKNNTTNVKISGVKEKIQSIEKNKLEIERLTREAIDPTGFKLIEQ